MAREVISFGSGPGTQTGDTAYVGGQKINSNFEEVYGMIDVLTRLDIIIEAKGFSLASNDLIINADWQWYINNELYANVSAVLFEDIALSASGNSRLVYVVPNNENGFTMIDGEETTGTPSTPELPNGGMYVTYFTVTDSGIGTPADGYDGNALNDKLSKGGYEGTAQTLSNRIDNYDNYGKKQYESYWRDVSLTGAVIDLDISSTESTSLNFTNEITELNSVIFPPASTQPYSGKDFYIKNSQAASFLIKHEIGNIATEQRYIFSLPREVDLELKPKQIAHFKLKTSGDRGKIELVGVVLDESNLMHLTGDEEVDGNKTFLQPVSGETATNPEHLVTKAQLDLKLDASAYNDRFKGKFLTEAAMRAAYPTANVGDEAQVNEVGSETVKNFLWDDELNDWVQSGSGGSGATNTDALPEGSTNLYFTTARVLATVLTGISFVTGGAIVSTDSVLVAFGKLQKQINDLLTSVGLKQDALVSGTNIKTINGSSILGSGDMTISSGGGDMTTTTDQTVSGIKTFLAGKFGLRNSGNTFTSFFTNSNTASRTYTLQNRNGTLADDTDLAGKMAVPSGTANYLSKFLTSTTIGLSRLWDTGTFFGVGTSLTPTKDITLGNQVNRNIGVENSDSSSEGRDLSIEAGKTVNYNLSSNFNSIASLVIQARDMCAGINNDLYVAYFGTLYKQTNGTGGFTTVISGASYNAVGVDKVTGSVYVALNGGSILKQTNGTGPFIDLSQPIKAWKAIRVHQNGNVYATCESGVYMQTGGIGNFDLISGTSGIAYYGLAINPLNGDVYVNISSGASLHKQVAGSGSFTLDTTNIADRHMAFTPTGDLIVYKPTSSAFFKRNVGTSVFTQITEISGALYTVAVTDNTNVYASIYSTADIYMQNNVSLGSPNLNGGNLILKAGTGKGTGQSRIPFYTGQKTTSGTDMQIETLRGYFDENGFFVHLSTPVYANDAAADSDTNLPSGAHYKITGSRQLYQKP